MSFDMRKLGFKLPSGWTYERIGDIAKINDQSIQKKDAQKSIFYIDISSVSTGEFNHPKEMKFNEAPSRARRKLKNDDFIISTVRPNLKQYAYMENISENWIASTGFCVVSANAIYSAWYLYAVVTSEFFTDYLVRIADGGAYPAFNPKEIENAIIFWPDEKTLKFINNLSKSINKLNFNNKNINQTLEQMAQAIFKSWFVDFDPVKAKMNGEQPEGMDAATASLFPDKLVESELGLIPEGWEIKEAKSELDVLRGFSYKGEGLVSSVEQGIPMHNLNSVLEGGGYKYSGLKFYSGDFKDKFKIQEGDVLVANTEQGHNHLLIGYGAMVPKHLAYGFFSHHTYRVRAKKNSNLSSEFIEQLFGKGRFVRQVQGFTNGTTVNMLPIAGMEMPVFIVPPKALVELFSKLVKPMKAMIEENHRSNIDLANLRDTLLPKLLSGEIQLENTETPKELEAAL